MKNKLCSTLIILFLAVTLYGCAEQTNSPEALVIESTTPCTKGTVEVLAPGVTKMEYRGEIDIINDGRNGEPIEIVLKVGEENE